MQADLYVTELCYRTQVLMMNVIYSSDQINITVHHCTAMVRQRYCSIFRITLVKINSNVLE